MFIAAIDGEPCHPRDLIRRAEAKQTGVGWNFRLPHPTKQDVKSLSRNLSRDVPQGDVEGGQGVGDGTVPRHVLGPAAQIGHERVDIGRITPDRQRRDHMQQRKIAHRAGTEAERFAPAGHACIGLDPNIDGILPLASRRRRQSLVERHRNQRRFNARDFHGGGFLSDRVVSAIGRQHLSRSGHQRLGRRIELFDETLNVRPAYRIDFEMRFLGVGEQVRILERRIERCT